MQTSRLDNQRSRYNLITYYISYATLVAYLLRQHYWDYFMLQIRFELGRMITCK